MHSANPSKNINAHFKRRETDPVFSGVLTCTDSMTQSYTRAYNPETALSASLGYKQTAASGSYAVVCFVF